MRAALPPLAYLPLVHFFFSPADTEYSFNIPPPPNRRAGVNLLLPCCGGFPVALILLGVHSQRYVFITISVMC